MSDQDFQRQISLIQTAANFGTGSGGRGTSGGRRRH